MKTTRAYYAIIPAHIRYDKDLTANAKLLYGEITALCNDKGYCWASNEYFAELYGVSGETASRWISSLRKKGYIKTSIIYKDGTKEIKGRRIYITNAPIDENINTPIDENINTSPQKCQDPIDENVNTPIDENVKDNNTINNTRDISITSNTSSGQATTQPKSMDLIIKKWNELGLQQLKHINPNTSRYKMVKARANEYGYNEILNAIDKIRGSSFLRGQNPRSWIITFDWLIKPNNFIKVLEGNYNDKGDANETSVGNYEKSTGDKSHGKYAEFDTSGLTWN